jgi:acetyltransferase-like isoleucine patch superfamily enzyme
MAFSVALALLRGRYYILKFRLLGRNVIVGRRFRVVGGLDIRGPGAVIFGDDCIVFSTRVAPTTPWTQSRRAVIRFGSGVALNGARLSCVERIEVGDRAMLAEARITDTDFHAIGTCGEHRLKSTGVTKPVVIGRNAWVCMGAMVLKGARIGENSVVAAGAVVAGRVPPNVIVFGNPARVVWRLKASSEPVAAGEDTALIEQQGNGRGD